MLEIVQHFKWFLITMKILLFMRDLKMQSLVLTLTRKTMSIYLILTIRIMEPLTNLIRRDIISTHRIFLIVLSNLIVSDRLVFLEEFQKLPSKDKELAVQDWTDTITGWSHFIGWIKVLKKMPIMNKARRRHLMHLLKMKVKRQPQQKSIIYHSKYNQMRVHCLLTRHLFLNQDLNLETWERQLRLDPQNTSYI